MRRREQNRSSDLQDYSSAEVEKGNKVLVTTLTKRMAEELTDYLRGLNVKVKYLHSDIDTLERMEIVRDLRLGVFDVLVGINLLREGLDIPEITLVAILDADKEGFMYADTITDSMRKAIDETNRRREIQQKYNEENGITPQTIRKAVRELISTSLKAAEEEEKERKSRIGKDPDLMNKKELGKEIDRITKKMNMAAAELNFELAAILRDELIELKVRLRDYDT